MSIKTICVFCGARDGNHPKYIKAAEEFGRMLKKHNMALVYGGGDCGIMGAVANATLKAGAEVTGVFPKFLNQYESEHKNLTKMILVEDMHTRKWTMFEYSDAIVVFPGGFGTLDETFEVITWKQLQVHKKPIILYNQDGYWNPFVDLANNIIAHNFASESSRNLFKIANSLEEIFHALGK